jgi:hypothetical protein
MWPCFFLVKTGTVLKCRHSTIDFRPIHALNAGCWMLLLTWNCCLSSAMLYEGESKRTPIRYRSSASGVLPDAGDGLHGFQRADECRRACLLPINEEPVRADGNVRQPRMLPESASECSRQRDGYSGGHQPLYCDCRPLGFCRGMAEGESCCHGMGRAY